MPPARRAAPSGPWRSGRSWRRRSSPPVRSRSGGGGAPDMPVRILDVDLENFRLIPRECRDVLFWEMDHEDPQVPGRFQKEEWFSSTLLEWGPCGKLAAGDDGDENGRDGGV